MFIDSIEKKYQPFVYALLVIIILHIVSMYIAPWFIGGFSWIYIQEVWDRWQGIIVGFLATISSVIFFIAIRGQEESLRKRELYSARAQLPDALSELYDYCKNCMIPLNEIWKDLLMSPPKQGYSSPVPPLPKIHTTVFPMIIAKSHDEDLSNHLMDILVKLQINNAILEELSIEDDTMLPYQSSLLHDIYRVAELMALISKTFPYARREEESIDTKITLPEIKNSLWALGAKEERYTGLDEMIRKRVRAGDIEDQLHE